MHAIEEWLLQRKGEEHEEEEDDFDSEYDEPDIIVEDDECTYIQIPVDKRE